jgi:ribonucleotide reductase beta subunit family protein with ferritin-like domain
MTVFNKRKVNTMKQPMFFGEELSTQRYDDFKYPIFDKLTQTQLGYFWRPEEVSLQKDRNDYQSLDEGQKHIFTSNLKYQTLLDSVQGRGPALALLPYCSIPELEGCILAWDFMESIHSRSYTYIVKNLYSNPTEVFDTILDTKEIVARAESVTRQYDEFIEYAMLWKLNQVSDTRELKRLFYLMMVSINILEGLRFYVSFACTFGFGELRLMEGSAKIISLIARDESQHLAISQHIIKNYQKNEGDKEMLSIMKECEDKVYDMYREAVQEEKDWAKYLFKDGSMIGLSETLLGQYVEYIANKRLKSLGFDPIFDQSIRHNPLPWTQHWLSSRGQQNAPQETEIESYIIGGIKQDITEDSFGDFKL